MKRRGLFRSVIALLVAAAMVFTELPVMPQSLTSVFAGVEDGENTVLETTDGLPAADEGTVAEDLEAVSPFKALLASAPSGGDADLATKYAQYVSSDYPYIDNYKSGFEEIVLTSYESQRGDMILEWPGTEDAAYYDIFRNKTWITSIAADAQMSYDDGAVEGSQTYNYVVFARNNSDEIIGTSKAISCRTKEALVISSYTNLDSDMSVFSVDITGGNLYLNGHTLTVCRDITVTNGYNLNMNAGKVKCYGNVLIGSENYYGYLNMSDSNESLYVAGNLECRKGSLDFKNGTVEIGGDLTVVENASLYCSVPNTVIFSGFDLQNVSMPEWCSFAEVELKNYSLGGVNFEKAYSYTSIKTNNTVLKIAGESTQFINLTEDTVIEGNYELEGGLIVLNGHSFTVTGDFIQNSGNIDVAGGILTINGDYIQMSGKLDVNGGTVNIGGDYRMQNRTGTEGNYTYGKSNASLYMTSVDDMVNIAGGFFCASSNMSSNTMNAGRLSIGKDLEFYSSRGSYYFETCDAHTTVLNGSGSQTVKTDYLNSYGSYIKLANVEIENSTDGNVIFNEKDNIIIKNSINDNGHAFGGRIQTGSYDTIIANDVLNGSLMLDYNSKNFYNATEIKGNLYVRTSCYIYNDFKVSGNIYLGEQYIYNGYSGDEIYEYTSSDSGYLYIYGTPYSSSYNGSLYVGGSIICDKNYSQDFYNYGGTVSVGGDFLLNDGTYFTTSYTQDSKYIFCGNQKQTIHVPDNMNLGNIVILNESAEGVVSTDSFLYESIVTNGNNFSFVSGNGRTGWILDENEIIDGDLVLVNGTLDLNGHELKIEGNLIQPGGTVLVNGGKLIIGGDYRIQSVSETENTEGVKETVYGKSAGILVMTDENDEVYINGGFYDTSSQGSSYNRLKAGVMDVKGDFIIDGNYNSSVFSSNENHKVIFSGESSQKIEINHCYASSYLNNVEITNPVDDNVFFGKEGSSVLFNGEFNDNGHHISGFIQPTGNSSFKNGIYNGSVYITNSGSVYGTYHITGDLIINNYMYLYGEMTVNGDVIFNNYGSLYLYGDETESNLEVKGNIRAADDCTYCYLYFSRGNLKLCGNLDVQCCEVSTGAYNTGYYDTNRFILCGTEKQTVEVASGSSFGQIVIENTSEEGVYSHDKFNALSVKDDNNKLHYGTYAGNEDTEGRFGWTLQQDETIDKDLILYDKILDLNGHTLTVNGDLIQAGGLIFVNNGTLVVTGDYRVQTRTTSAYGFSYNDSTGSLKMVNDNDTVKIGGNYYNQSTQNGTGLLTAGKMYVGGDFDVSKSSAFQPSGSHTVIFNVSGYNKLSKYYNESGKHYVSGASFTYRNLEIENGNYVYIASSYICARGNVKDNGTTVGGTLYIYPETTFTDNIYHGNVVIYGSGEYKNPYEITGNMIVSSTAHFSGNLTVDGNVTVNRNIEFYLEGEESEFNVKGTLYLEYYSSLYLNNKINNFRGSSSIYSRNNYTKIYFNCEKVNCYGNISLNYSYTTVKCSAGTELNFCGNTAQTVTLNDNYKFADIVINNTSGDGVKFNRTVLYDSLTTNGYKVQFGNNTFETGLTLTEDKEIEGDFYLGGGELNLAGHKLTVKGDLFQTGGKTVLNGGKLTVEGDYNITGLDNSGKPSGKSNGTLVMSNSEDYLLVKGNVRIIQDTTGTEAGPNTLTAGVFEMMGDCVVDYDTLKGTDSFKIVFSGSRERKVTGTVRAPYFENRCTADEAGTVGDILMNGSLYISEKVTDDGQNIKGSGYLYLYDFSVIENNSYSGNIYLNYTSEYNEEKQEYIYSECTMTDDLTIGGLLYMYSKLNLDKFCLKVGSISVRNQLNIQEGKLVCTGDLSMGYDGNLEMTEDETSIFVGGNFSTYSSSSSYRPLTVNFTAGTFELQGNFSDTYTPSSFNSSGTNTVILSGKTVNGSDFIQSINISDTKVKFNKLILKKPDTAYKFSRSVSKMAKEVIRDVDTSGIPTNVSELTVASYTESSVKLLYSEASDDNGVTGYRICRNGTVCGVTTELTFTDTGLKPNTAYIYTVFAIDAENNISESSPSVTVTTKEDKSRPEPVKSMSVSRRTGSSVTLTWKAAVDNVGIKEYELYRRSGNEEYELIAEHIKKTTYKDEGITAGIQYKYYLIAIDTSGNRSENGIETDASAALPQIYSVSPYDKAKLGGNYIEFSVIYTNWGNSLNNTVLIDYEDKNNEWKPVTTYPLGQSVYQNSTNLLYSTYKWYMGDAEFNDSVRFRITLTDEDNNTAEKIVSCIFDRTAPAVPEDFAAADNGGTVRLTWKPSASDDCTGYNIYRSTSVGQEYTKIGYVSGRNTLSYTDNSVKKDVKYYYAIEAYDDFNNISEKAESGEIVVEDDRQAPVVRSIGPDKSVIGNGTVTIITRAEDNKAVKSVVLSIRKEAESNWSSLNEVLCTEGTALYNLNTAAYEDGVYYIRAVARDEEGNVSGEFIKRFVFDNTGIAKTTLTGSAVSSTVVNLVWDQELTESDFDYYSIERLVRIDDGVPVYARIAEVKDNYNYYVSDLIPGEEQTYIVVGYDIYGNRGIESDPVTVATFVDTTGPSIATLNGSGTPYSDIIPLSVRAKDNLALGYALFRYSLDGINYEDINRVDVSSAGVKEETFIYNWDISMLPEGKVYVLYEVYDASGYKNLLTADNQDVVAELIIDRTAPEKVTGLSLIKSSGSVEFSWDSPKAEAEEDKVVGFVVMRADATTGIFKTIATDYKATNYIDKTVSVGKEYIYKVAALDAAGNQSEFSDVLRVSVFEDNIAPEIYWISSENRDVLPMNPEIHILAFDNRNLAKLIVEYSAQDSDTETWITLYDGPVSGTDEEKTVTWNTNGLTEGKYTVRAYAIDENGNESEYKTKEFSLDLTAPEKPVIKVTNGNMYIDLEIEGTEPEDFSRYEIYRRESGSEEKVRIYRGTEKTFRDMKAEPLKVYVYQTVIYDVHDNEAWSDEVEGTASDIDDIAPEAILTSDTITGVEGDEITLFGGNSYDNVGITEYKWYIDDTYIGSGIQIVHKFTEVNVYNLKLEVYDLAGNVGRVEGQVVISEKETTGTFVITVKSEDGVPLGGASINIREPNGNNKNERLNNNASVSFSRAPGVYQVAAYVDGYLPNDITVSVNAQEKKEYEIRLKKQELLEASVSVRKLSFAELKQQGVDLSDPANYNTVEVSFDVMIDAEIVTFKAVVTPNKSGKANACGGGSGTGSGSGTGTGSETGDYYVSYIEDRIPIIVHYESRPAVSWLKDMYEVYVSILNNASTEYSIADLTATLTLPQDISFAALSGREQTETIELGTLYGQNSCSASWIVKGSRSGNYDFVVDINGTVMPFERPYSTQAASSAYIDATAGNNLHLFIVLDKGDAISGKNFVNYALVNEGKKDYQNVSIVLSGESLEYNGEEKDIDINENKVTIGTLKQWTPIYLHSLMSDTTGTAYEESDLDYHVNYLRGKNLGLKISVVKEVPDFYYKAGKIKTKYGDLKWEVKYGILTLEGEGDYADPTLSPASVKAPWHDGETEKHIGKAEIDVKNMTLTTAMFEDCTKLKSFEFKNGTDKVTNMSRMFKNCTSLSDVHMEQLKSSAVTDISYMFMDCTALSKFDCENFLTNTVTDATGMFKNCSALRELDLNSWDFFKVKKVDNFLYDCIRLYKIESPRRTPTLDISLKDCCVGATWEMKIGSTTEAVTSIVKDKKISLTYTRKGGYSPDDANFDVESDGFIDESYGQLTWSIKNGLLRVSGTGDYIDPNLMGSRGYAPDEMFYPPWYEYREYFSYAKIDVTDMTTAYNMFLGCENLREVSFNDDFTKKITSMEKMFYNCKALKEIDLSRLQISKAVNCSFMFANCTALKSIDFTKFNLNNAISVGGMLDGCTSLEEVITYKTGKSSIVLPKNHNFDVWHQYDKDGNIVTEEVYGTNAESDSTAKYLKKYKMRYGFDPKKEFVFHYATYDNKIADYNFRIDFNDFFMPSQVYNDRLIDASIRTAMAAFDASVTDGAEAAKYNSKRDSCIEELMENLGFTDLDGYYPTPSTNSIGYKIGSRKIVSDSTGKESNLVLVAVRGAGYEAEWGGNFNVGDTRATGNHAGWETAADTIIEHLKLYINELDNRNEVKVWVVGYSRAGATSNLVCAKLIDGAIGKVNNPDNVFGFCFECPKTTVNANAHDDRYKGIKNIINPIDIVPKVVMNNKDGWNFIRYGVTYTIPSAVSVSNYASQKSAMKYYYKKMLSRRKEFDRDNTTPSNEVEVNTQEQQWLDLEQLLEYNGIIGPQQEKSFDNIIKFFADTAVNPSVYKERYQAALVNLLVKVRGKQKLSLYEWDTVVNGLAVLGLSALDDGLREGDFGEQLIISVLLSMLESELEDAGIELISSELPFLGEVIVAVKKVYDIAEKIVGAYAAIKNGVGLVYFSRAHYPELCLAWMDSIQELSKLGYIEAMVNCPVDVNVYDSEGKLVGYIKDDVPQAIEDGLLTFIDENGQKIVYMPCDQEYTIEMIATNAGEVTYTLKAYGESEGDYFSVINYPTVSVNKDDVLVSKVSMNIPAKFVDEYGELASEKDEITVESALFNTAGEEVEPLVVQTGDEITMYIVSTDSDRTKGITEGDGDFVYGEFCKVTATANEGYKFVAWKQGSRLVSEEAEYRFKVTKDVELTAEFEKSDNTDGGNTEGGNTGNEDGGNTEGGNTGNEDGGNEDGGNTSGGNTSGGNTSGGNTSGGNTSGGNTSGTDIIGGNTGDSGNAAGETGEGGNTGNTNADNTGKETGNNEGNGGNDKSDDKEKETPEKFKVKVGAVYTDENGVRYTITAIEGKKKATENTVKYLGPDSSSVKKIVIPDTVTIEGKTFAVTALDTAWTKGNKKLETVVINDNIKKITADTFKGCTSLKKITLGANVTAIGKNAFYKCTALKTVKLSANLTKIGDAAFYACKSLKKITIPSKVKTIGEKAFYKCTSLKSVTMSSTVLTGIGSKAFFDCGGLEKITIPSKVDAIGTYAFYRCRKLGNVTIKTKLLNAENVGKKAFAGLVPDAVITVPKAKVKEYTDLLKKVGVTKKMTVKK